MLDERERTTSFGLSLRNSISRGGDDDQEFRPFASGRIGSRPQLTVTFRSVDGSSYSFAYSHFYCITSETESGGFMIEFSQHLITIHGRNLSQLHRYLCDHKVHTVQATSPTQEMAADDDQPVVTSIRVQKIAD